MRCWLPITNTVLNGFDQGGLGGPVEIAVITSDRRSVPKTKNCTPPGSTNTGNWTWPTCFALTGRAS